MSSLRERLDVELVRRGLVATRARARDAVKRGLVFIDGEIATKPAHLIGPDQDLSVAAEAIKWVSRAGSKLEAALDHFGFDAKDRIALDAGASTGGFSQVLLQYGASRVYAVDVGRGQLHLDLRDHPALLSLEGVDVRELTSDEVPVPVGCITCDVSFISVTKVLPNILSFAAPNAWLVILIKPQFEVGRTALGKGGVVRDERAQISAVEKVENSVARMPGWQVCGVIASPITGGDGNREYLLGAVHDG